MQDSKQPAAPSSHEDRRGGVDVLLVCSTGGHLLQLGALADAWAGLSHAWVTFDKSDARSLLAGDRVYYAYGPTNRSIPNFLRNLPLAWGLLGYLRPRVIVTTGAGVAVPFAWLGRLRGARVVYVESFTRIDGPSLSCRLIRPVADRVYVQWPELAERLPGARYLGSIFSAR
jgi:UDP-N-acetylglucosamine:LPS N-acetylglucosamine transferase